MDVQGFTATGFEAVAEVFARNFERYGDVGAAFAAYRDGEPVVDLWGGTADPATGRPWYGDTLQLVFSGAKGLTAACVLLLIERGLLDLDAGRTLLAGVRGGGQGPDHGRRDPFSPGTAPRRTSAIQHRGVAGS